MAKILIAEDMLTILRLFRDILESSGHVVVGEAKNSSEAIQSYEKFKPDILILDLFGMNSYSEKHKREINSFDVIEELYKKYKANIIIVTGSSRQEYIDKSMLLGAKEYFVKGEPIDLFLQKIDNLLNYNTD